MEDKRYYIELEVITPLSVGAGNDYDWTKGIDYIQKDGKVYVIDINKVMAQGIDIDRLTQLFLLSDERGICQILGNRLESVSKYVFSSPSDTNNSIKTFLRTQLYDKPLVAGSSLKGAIRSVLFKHLRTEGQKDEVEIFGNPKNGTDLMRFIKVSDIELPSTVLINTKVFNLRKEHDDWTGGWKHKGTHKGDYETHTYDYFSSTGFNTVYECVVPGMKGFGSITLASAAYDIMVKSKEVDSEKKQKLITSDITHLFQVINQGTAEYLQKEKAFFSNYPAERTDELIECIDRLLNSIPSDGSSCLIKMSAGTGFHSITGDWQYKDYSEEPGIWEKGKHRGKKKYKSRKIAEHDGQLQLMGFVRLRRLSQEEADIFNSQLQQDHSNIIETMMAPIREREKQIQKEKEKLQRRLLAAQEEEQRKKDYLSLVEQARQHYQQEQWDVAITCLKRAEALCPDSAEVRQEMERCINSQKAEEFRQKEAAATALKFSQPLANVIKGKKTAGNLVGTTVKWLKVEGHSFGEQECEAFLIEANHLPAKEWDKLKKKLHELTKYIGNDATEVLINKLENE